VIHQKGLNPKFGTIEISRVGLYRWARPDREHGEAETYAEARLMLLVPHLRKICATAIRRWDVSSADADAAIQSGIIAVWEALSNAKDPTPRGLNDSYLIFRARRWATAEVGRLVTRYERRYIPASSLASGVIESGEGEDEAQSIMDYLAGSIPDGGLTPATLAEQSDVIAQILAVVQERAESPETYTHMLSLLAQGYSAPETGRQMGGKSKQAVQDRLYRLRGWLSMKGLTQGVLEAGLQDMTG
jgi:hypothetical protein